MSATMFFAIAQAWIFVLPCWLIGAFLGILEYSPENPQQTLFNKEVNKK
jgi:cellobiose-specific phosphotransferase system component IIC